MNWRIFVGTNASSPLKIIGMNKKHKKPRPVKSLGFYHFFRLSPMSAHINIGVINMGKVLDIGAKACELLINSCSQTGID